MAPILRSRRLKDFNLPPPALRRSPRLTRRAAVKNPHSNLASKKAIRLTNPRSRPYCSRSRKMGVSTNIDSLPDELLLDILSRVPVEDIQEKARFVCWRRKRIVHRDDFAQAHLHRTGYGLLISMGRMDPPVFMAATHDGGIEVSKLITKSKFFAKASCNGLILLAYIYKGYVLHVVNPATKCCFKLSMFYRGGMCHYFGIAYASASMKYKVVGTYHSRENPMLEQQLNVAVCNVFTVGVDKSWRHVATQQFSPEANKLFYQYRDPLITKGFMHWASSSGNVVLTLNVETEVFAESRAPLAPILREYHIQERGQYHFLSTGRHLSVLICSGDFLWQVWEMKGGSGEWTKVLPDIDLNARKSEIQLLALKDDFILRPVGWVKYPEVLLFFPDNTSYNYNKQGSLCIVYNLDRDEIKSVKLPASIYCREAMVHKKSLVWLS